MRTFEYSFGGVTMKVPTGCMFTHIIRGSGRKITYQNAGVETHVSTQEPRPDGRPIDPSMA